MRTWVGVVIAVVVMTLGAARASAKPACASAQACVRACDAAHPAACVEAVARLDEELDTDDYVATWSTPPWVTSLGNTLDSKLPGLCVATAPTLCTAAATVARWRRSSRAEGFGKLACDGKDGAGCRVLGDTLAAAGRPADALLAYDRGCKLKDAGSCLGAAAGRALLPAEKDDALAELARACAKGAKAQRVRACDLHAARAESSPGPLTTKACALGAARACDRLGQAATSAADRVPRYGPGCLAGNARVCRWWAVAALGQGQATVHLDALQRACDAGDLESCRDAAALLLVGGTPSDPRRYDKLLGRACAGEVVAACVSQQVRALGTKAAPASAKQRAAALAALGGHCQAGQGDACRALLADAAFDPKLATEAQVATVTPIVDGLCRSTSSAGCSDGRDQLRRAGYRLRCDSVGADCAAYGLWLIGSDVPAGSAYLDRGCKAGDDEGCAHLSAVKARSGDAAARADVVARCQDDQLVACDLLASDLTPTPAERLDALDRICRIDGWFDECAEYAELVDGDTAATVETKIAAYERACDAAEEDWDDWGGWDDGACDRLGELRESKRVADEAKAKADADAKAAAAAEVAAAQSTPEVAPGPAADDGSDDDDDEPRPSRGPSLPRWLLPRLELAAAQLTIADVDGGWAGELGVGLATHRGLIGEDSMFRIGVSLGAHARGGRADARWTHDAGGALGAYLGLGPSLELGVAYGAAHVGWGAREDAPTSPLPSAWERGLIYSAWLRAGSWAVAGTYQRPERTALDVVTSRTRWSLELERLRWSGRPIGLGLERSELDGVSWYAVRLRYGSAPLP